MFILILTRLSRSPGRQGRVGAVHPQVGSRVFCVTQPDPVVTRIVHDAAHLGGKVRLLVPISLREQWKPHIRVSA